MKKIAFIGGYDKTNLILYVSKILTVIGKKVLVVDTTACQKTKYTLPKMVKGATYITTFERMDVAIGFANFKQIEQYSGKRLDYDYVLLDIDSPVNYRNFKLTPDDLHLFVTAFDLYSLKKGFNVFKALLGKTVIHKVYFSQNMTSSENEFVDQNATNENIEWGKEIVYFPITLQDMEAMAINERMSKIKFRNFTKDFMASLQYIAELVDGEDSARVRKAIKFVDR